MKSPRSFVYRHFAGLVAFAALVPLGSTAMAQDAAPQERRVVVFPLRHAPADSMAQLIAKILGDNGARVAVDARTNSLVISGDAQQLNLLHELLESIDLETAERSAQKSAFTPTQVRVYWLMTGPGGAPMPEALAPVVDEMKELGIEGLQLAGQMSINVGSAGRPFSISSRPMVGDNEYSLQFDGVLTESADGRPTMESSLNCETSHDAVSIANLETSIDAPLNQFIVLGTTAAHNADSVFVLQLVPRPSPPASPK